MQESPPFKSSSNGLSKTASGLDPDKLFIDLHGMNVGFKHWHPTPVIQDGDKLAGQAGMGGVWEWTSTVLDRYEGFEPMELYPAYTGKQYSPAL